MVIKGKEITKEKVIQAMQCNTADELIALAKADGIELTKEEAEAYMAEMADLELDENELKYAAWVRREEIVPQPNNLSLTNEMMKKFRDNEE